MYKLPLTRVTPIIMFRSHRKKTNNENIIGGAKAQRATLLRGP